MRTWVLRALLGLCVLLLVVVIGLWLTLRASLPKLEGEQPLAHLAAPVTIERDANGLVTITAASQTDAMRALGFVHAQERYFEMDLLRRLPAGELSALLGSRALDTDRGHRVHRLRARVGASFDRFAGDHAPELEAYAEGANSGLAALSARPWAYLLLRQRPRPWTPQDSALAGFAMYFYLQDATNAREFAMSRLDDVLPPALLALLAHKSSRWDAPLFGDPTGDAVLPDAEAVDLRRLEVMHAGDTSTRTAFAPARPAVLSPVWNSLTSEPTATDLAVGSNNFAVSGKLTADARALVADDMHLGLRAPNIWFRVRLRYPDPRAAGGQVDVTGFTLPGLPAVIVGSNTQVAWGFTNSYGDYLDWQRVLPCASGVSSSPANCTPIEQHEERIEVAGGAPVMLTVEQTAWGPLMHREPDATALALRWTAHLPGALNFALADFAHARDLEEVLAIADLAATPTQNLVVGDRTGRIAWRLIGPIPERSADCDGSRVLPADNAENPHPCAPWSITTNASPVLRDADRLWTANSRVVDGEDYARVGDGGTALGMRSWQIREGLQKLQQVREPDLLAIQLDDRAILLSRWYELMRSRAAQTGTQSALHDLVQASADWSGHASVDSAGYRMVQAWRQAVHDRLADGLVAPARVSLGEDFKFPVSSNFEGVVWPLVQERPAHLLPRRFACTADTQQGTCTPVTDGWQALFEDAARDVRDSLAALGPLNERTWGERNMTAICHPLANAIPLLGKHALCMPAEPLPGDGTVPRAQGPAFGASQRMVVAPGHEAEGIAHMPGGQSGHPLSPFWGAGHNDWAKGKPSPFLPGATTYTLRLVPDPKAGVEARAGAPDPMH